MARRHSDPSLVRANARHGSLRRSSTWTNLAKILLAFVVVVSVSGVSVAAYAALALKNEIKTVDLGVIAPDSGPDAVGAGAQSIDGELNILLVGSDSRKDSVIDDGEEGELNDVNLLLHVPADHQSATIISFPRDLMVPIPSCPGPNGEPNYYSAMSEQMLNSAMTYGGLPCVVETISGLTGMTIPYAAVVTFDGVINISRAIGGVEVCLSQPIVDPKADLDLPAGNVSLSGVEALQFLRSRYGVGDGSDVSRISNQQVFMSALLRQMRSAETLSDPIKVYSLAKTGVMSMEMSTSMGTIPFFQALAGTAVNIDLDRINFVQYPSSTHPYDEGRLTPDRYLANQLIEVVLSGEQFEVQSRGEAAVDAPSEEEPVAEEPTSGDEEPEPVQTTEPDTSVTVLPPGITGQSAADQTCSAGRTQW